VAEHSKASRGVAEALGGLGGRDPLEEVGAEGFVLAVGGVGRFEEDLPDIDVCYLFDLFQRLTMALNSCNGDDYQSQGSRMMGTIDSSMARLNVSY
jgi:hypothetical protein